MGRPALYQFPIFEIRGSKFGKIQFWEESSVLVVLPRNCTHCPWHSINWSSNSGIQPKEWTNGICHPKTFNRAAGRQMYEVLQFPENRNERKPHTEPSKTGYWKDSSASNSILSSLFSCTRLSATSCITSADFPAQSFEHRKLPSISEFGEANLEFVTRTPI